MYGVNEVLAGRNGWEWKRSTRVSQGSNATCIDASLCPSPVQGVDPITCTWYYYQVLVLPLLTSDQYLCTRYA